MPEVNTILAHATQTPMALLAVAIFILAYFLVAVEEFLHLKKSMPVILAAGLIWILVAVIARRHGVPAHQVEAVITQHLSDFCALFLFLLTAMTYINTIIERNVFEALRGWLMDRGYSDRRLFWITGFLAFFISPVADNMTTALIMGTVVLATSGSKPKVVALSCINIVVAANAGGAFSPFGDITTLMVWQSGKLQFQQFFALFLPALTSFLIPAFLMSMAIPYGKEPVRQEPVKMKPGAIVICLLFLCTIITAVVFEQFLHLPPFLGMTTGLAYLFFYTYLMQRFDKKGTNTFSEFNVYREVARSEWDTLLFFFGVIFCVGGLGALGYLELSARVLYINLGATTANISIGVLSAIIDNIPLMFSVLNMNPDMNIYQWTLVTLTAGIGGSLLSIGSAAGVALMGHSKGMYSFFSHLRWSWAVALGYAGGIYVHYLLSRV